MLERAKRLMVEWRQVLRRPEGWRTLRVLLAIAFFVILLASTCAHASEPLPQTWQGHTGEVGNGTSRFATCNNVAEGWSYNESCCCTTGWCAPIPHGAVRTTPDGYVVTLRPGEHPRASATVSFLVPFRQAGTSPNGSYHACGSTWATDGGSLRCLLVPPGGV
jgi:hypothetical protein